MKTIKSIKKAPKKDKKKPSFAEQIKKQKETVNALMEVIMTYTKNDIDQLNEIRELKEEIKELKNLVNTQAKEVIHSETRLTTQKSIAEKCNKASDNLRAQQSKNVDFLREIQKTPWHKMFSVKTQIAIFLESINF